MKRQIVLVPLQLRLAAGFPIGIPIRLESGLGSKLEDC